MNREKYLPIGTVCLLDNATKKVMIIGFAAKGKESGDKMFDYVGCMYPEGMLSSEQNLLFNHNQIKEIYYMGYSNNEDKEFKNRLVDLVNKLETNNN